MNESKRIVKKYPNRRLYDTHESRYITLEDVRQLVVNGQTVKVIENKTGRDISCAILLQVITELDRPSGPPLSEDFLTSIIKAHHGGFTDVVSRYLDASLALALDQEPLQNGTTLRVNGDGRHSARFERWLALQREIGTGAEAAQRPECRTAQDIGA